MNVNAGRPSAQLMEADLARSGLSPKDINSRPLDSAERAATGTLHSVEGYVIPYFNLVGKQVPFYRVRLFDADPKYKQPAQSQNHVYFPPGFQEVSFRSSFVIFTEGEKKAAIGVRAGYPTVAFGGVDSWRNRTLFLPTSSEITQNTKKERIQVKLPADGAPIGSDDISPYANGFQELVDYCIRRDLHILICYDTDEQDGTIKPAVQRAAARLGFELRYMGVKYARIKQLILPQLASNPSGKTAIDDYLVDEVFAPKFKKLVAQVVEAPAAFPQHPALVEYINRRLSRAKMSRKENQQVAIAILCDMDSHGMRLADNDSQIPYFFDRKTHRLYRADFNPDLTISTNSLFGQYLYRRYGIASSADIRVLQWIATQFTGEEPFVRTTTYRLLARTAYTADEVHYQISDGRFVTIAGQVERSTAAATLPGLTLRNNGDLGILFEADQCSPLDENALLEEYERQSRLTGNDFKSWWAEVLNDVRLRDKTRHRYILAFLYYLSPWLNRWRGLQVPIEIVTGEAGSGKSSLLELRLSILAGQDYAKLRQVPTDLRDWHASIVNAGGVHVTDNVQLADRNLRSKWSDELCRLVTEPRPIIEQRRLYTNTDVVRHNVNVSFAITSIQQPFTAPDILQRALITELDKAQDLSRDGQLRYDSNWRRRQLLRFGGREAWVAHHLVVLHRFLKLVSTDWNPRYAAHHRLIHLEQALILMGKVFGIDTSWVPAYLATNTDKAVVEGDWMFEGVVAFCDWGLKNLPSTSVITANDICNWAATEDDFAKNELLTNPRRLGKYLKSHRAQIQAAAGLEFVREYGGRSQFRLKAPRKGIE